MFRQIKLQLADGTEKEFPFLACGTTSVRFRMIFKKELLGSITGIINSIGTDQLTELMKIEQKAAEEGKEELTLDDIDPDTLQILLSIVGSGELDTISEMAFIMNKQAEKADMAELDLGNYLDWLEQFESMEFLTHAMDFIGLYMSNRTATSKPKKEVAQLIEK